MNSRRPLAGAVLPMDHTSDPPFEQRGRANYDHPDGLAHIRRGRAIERCTRLLGTVRVEPAPVVLEGLRVLFNERPRELMDPPIFVDAAPEVRFIRRLQRDIFERSPMHRFFVEPSKRYADVPRGGKNSPALDTLTTRILAAGGVA